MMNIKSCHFASCHFASCHFASCHYAVKYWRDNGITALHFAADVEYIPVTNSMTHCFDVLLFDIVSPHCLISNCKFTLRCSSVQLNITYFASTVCWIILNWHLKLWANNNSCFDLLMATTVSVGFLKAYSVWEFSSEIQINERCLCIR